MKMPQILQTLQKLALLPVVKINHSEDAIDLGNALLKGGLPCAEITFRTQAAEKAIISLTTNIPEMLVGAGTVLTVDQAKRAVDAGAKFIVTPGFDDLVVPWCLDQKILIIPGVATPTEINMALKFGVNVLKFFPAEALGGLNTLKAICAPYTNVRFVPTGGIGPDNIRSYLEQPQVLACGGSWLVQEEMISSGEFNQITQLTIEAVQIVREIRSQ
jgi:2-dehydro-3-deoxyphosphogluconate aldolase/(4S)-4-hydroxy-2-oxoglutarate aldolase